MKRHLSVLVCLVLALTMMFTLASCKDETHEHTYSDAWSYDATNHWHAASCTDTDECKSATSDLAAHNFGDGDTCTVCSYKKTEDGPVNEAPTLGGGTTTVTATTEGALYTYIAKLPGTYTIGWTAEDAVVSVKNEDGTIEAITAGYEFALESGEAITFVMATTGDVNYDVTVAVVEDPANALVVGANTVNTAGVVADYVFASKAEGTYTITWTDENAVVVVATAEGSEPITSGYEFTLGEREEIAFGIGTANFEEASFEVTIAPVEEQGDTNELEIGENEVNAGTDADAYTFYAKAEATYTITWTDENAEIVLITADGSQTITSGFEFTLGVKDSATFIMYTVDYAADTYNVTIAVAEEQGEDPYTLVVGDNTVNATYAGTKYTFTAKVAGTYVITFPTTGAYVGFEGEYGFEAYENGYEFTLAERESIEFLMAADEACTYVVTIAAKEEDPNSLIIGDNTVNATYAGVKYTFTAKAAGTYVITFPATGAYVGFEGQYGFEEYKNGYEFTLAERESIEFLMAADAACTYVVTITGKEPTVESNTLVVGDNTVNATYAGTKYTFTATEAGKFTITFPTTGAYVGFEGQYGFEEYKNGYEFTLAANESIEFLMAADAACTYVVTIAAAPSYVFGQGVHYNTPGDYVGSKNDWATLTSDDYSKSSGNAAPVVDKNILSFTTSKWGHAIFKNDNAVEGDNHVFETDLMFSNITKEWAGTVAYARFGAITLTAAADGAMTRASVIIYVNAVKGDDGITRIVLASCDYYADMSQDKIIATLEEGQWINLCVEYTDAKELKANPTATFSVDGKVVIENSTDFGGGSGKAAMGKLTGFGIECRDASATGYAGATFNFASTFMGSYKTPVVEVTPEFKGTHTGGAVYNSETTGARWDFDAADATAPVFAEAANITVSLADEKYVRAEQIAKAGSSITYYAPTITDEQRATKAYTVFETDIAINVDKVEKSCLVARFILDDATAYDTIVYIYYDIDKNVLTLPKWGKVYDGAEITLNPGEWFNIRFEYAVNLEGFVEAKVYINGEYKASVKGADDNRNKSTADRVKIATHNATSGVVIAYDNVYTGYIFKDASAPETPVTSTVETFDAAFKDTAKENVRLTDYTRFTTATEFMQSVLAATHLQLPT